MPSRYLYYMRKSRMNSQIERNTGKISEPAPKSGHWIRPPSLAELHCLGAGEEAIDVGFELGPP
jgi:hypothetical protein